jgi:hypothetical protein
MIVFVRFARRANSLFRRLPLAGAEDNGKLAHQFSRRNAVVRGWRKDPAMARPPSQAMFGEAAARAG